MAESHRQVAPDLPSVNELVSSNGISSQWPQALLDFQLLQEPGRMGPGWAQDGLRMSWTTWQLLQARASMCRSDFFLLENMGKQWENQYLERPNLWIGSLDL